MLSSIRHNLTPSGLLSAGFLLLTITSCSHIKPENLVEASHAKVETDIPSAEQVNLDLSKQATKSDDAVEWWKSLKDPALNRLIDVTLEKSNTIELAYARVEQAIAQRRSSRAGLFPSINLRGSAGVDSPNIEEIPLEYSTPGRINTATAELQATWATDIFGELRNRVRSDKASLAAEKHRLRDTQRILISQVITSYYSIIATRQQIALTKESALRRQQNVERINELLDRGYATRLDKTRTDSQWYESNASLAQLELQEATLLNELAVTVSVGLIEIRAMLNDATQIPQLSKKLPLPSITTFLLNRPDLREAEFDLYAAAFTVNSSKAALYPSLSTTLSVGKGPEQTGLLTGDFPNLNQVTAGIAANLTMPIFGRGRLLAQIDVNSALLKQAHVSYEQSMRAAISELDTSLVSFDKNSLIYEQRSEASASATEAAELSKELFKSGELDYTSVIVAEDTRVSAEIAAVIAHNSLVNAYINHMANVSPMW